jgi:hypothetical protein
MWLVLGVFASRKVACEAMGKRRRILRQPGDETPKSPTDDPPSNGSFYITTVVNWLLGRCDPAVFRLTVVRVFTTP